MPKFSVKSLTFYTIAITSVLLLFKLVTAYGDKLKAPKLISGKYDIILAENLSSCKKNTLVLDIQQSGIFLNASLSSTSTKQQISTSEEKKPSLNGKLNGNSFSLSGRVDNSSLCNTISDTAKRNQNPAFNGLDLLTLQASLVPSGGFSGQIAFKDAPKSIKFNAIPLKPQEQPTQSFK
ncbi:hypothetical protein NIES4071_58470 [Calothrix sp. NIES-4071]|nr:hypothetical protein NIES4071_58470 [Calothrix sp. NIES-4071]BAZ60154.1 hypothetical protein NIES4105_58420 [Calothrix sp. NIES-4105]